MTVVNHRLRLPDGSPHVTRVRVSVVVPVFHGPVEVRGVAVRSTDPTGSVSFDLAPNSELVPAGTAYVASYDGQSRHFVGPDGAGPLDLADLFTD